MTIGRRPGTENRDQTKAADMTTATPEPPADPPTRPGDAGKAEARRRFGADAVPHTAQIKPHPGAHAADQRRRW